MRAWKQTVMTAGLVMMVSTMVQAEDTAAKATTAKAKAVPKKHLVDMADGMNQQEFYNTRNPEAIWSTDGGSAPWTRTEAVNAWEQGEAGKTSGAVKEQDLQTGTTRPAAVPVLENGKPVEAGRSINIRVRYTLDPEHSKASYSPVSAQSELYRQMGSHCGNGFQKMSEWSTPIEGSDYYLYYQFRCMDIPQ